MKIECDRCSRLYPLEDGEIVLISLCPTCRYEVELEGLVVPKRIAPCD